MAVLLLLLPLPAVNLLFAFRYLARFGFHTPLMVTAYLVGFVAALAAVGRIRERILQRRALFLGVLALVSLGWIAVFQIIDVRDLRVDRWYMIDTFWSNVAAGRYPYLPRPDGNVPGPLPFYFVLALPFHLMGDAGYFALAGLLGYAGLVWRDRGLGRPAYVALLALLLSMSFLWEMTTRSTLVVDMVVVLGYLFWLEAKRPRGTRALNALERFLEPIQIRFALTDLLHPGDNRVSAFQNRGFAHDVVHTVESEPEQLAPRAIEKPPDLFPNSLS